MKYILFIVVFFLSCSKSKQNAKFFYKIVAENKFEKTKEDILKYKIMDTLIFKKTNDSILDISLSHSDGYEGYEFNCKISKYKKNIFNNSYEAWFDFENGNEYKHNIQNVVMIFSEDPFLKKENKDLLCNLKLEINQRTKFANPDIIDSSYFVNDFYILNN